jgi:hypothetical protein
MQDDQRDVGPPEPVRASKWLGAAVFGLVLAALWLAPRHFALSGTAARLVDSRLPWVHAVSAGLLAMLAVEALAVLRWTVLARRGGRDSWRETALRACERRIQEKANLAHPNLIRQTIDQLYQELTESFSQRCAWYVVAALPVSLLGFVLFCLELREWTAESPFNRLFLVAGTALLYSMVLAFLALLLLVDAKYALKQWRKWALNAAGVRWPAREPAAPPATAAPVAAVPVSADEAGEGRSEATRAGNAPAATAVPARPLPVGRPTYGSAPPAAPEVPPRPRRAARPPLRSAGAMPPQQQEPAVSQTGERVPQVPPAPKAPGQGIPAAKPARRPHNPLGGL